MLNPLHDLNKNIFYKQYKILSEINIWYFISGYPFINLRFNIRNRMFALKLVRGFAKIKPLKATGLATDSGMKFTSQT